jgi:hypothetical protein
MSEPTPKASPALSGEAFLSGPAEKLHFAICEAVSISNRSMDMARSEDGRAISDILRRVLIEVADEALSPAQAEPLGQAGAWISVEERLPEEGAAVLAAIHAWGDPTKPLIACHARYEFGLWIDLSPEDGSVGDTELYNPKLWLQVPELPPAPTQEHK